MRLLRRLRYWLRLRANHADLMDELAFHRELVERDLVEEGMSPDAARAEARRAMGNETAMREESRAVWLRPSLEALWQDTAYTLRDLRRNPTFTLGVVLTLALGIGANAAMFSLVDRLLLRPPARMIDAASVHRAYLYRTVRGTESETGGQYARYADLAKWSTAFTQTAAFRLRTLAVGTAAASQRRSIGIVSASFFEFFNAPPILGRYFIAGEDTPSNPTPVAVLSGALWTSQFGSRADVVGSKLQIDAVSYTIIGVAPNGFVGLWPYRPPAAWIPVTMYAASEGPANWATTYGHAIGLNMIVRRRPGVSPDAASADLTQVLRRSFQAQIGTEPSTTPLAILRPRALVASVLAERGPEPSDIARTAMWLSGVTLIVLLIACANVANLLLARTIRRRREIAVRIALGVSRSRLFAQLLTEGIVLALLGGVAGLVASVWGSNLLRAMFLPNTEPVSVFSDARTVLFAGAAALSVGVLSGLAPMAQVGRGNLIGDLKAGARDGIYRRTRVRTALLVFQSALSFVLLVGAGLFVRSSRNVRDVRLGFDADSVLLVSLNMRDVKVDSAATVALRLRLLDAVRDVPRVSHATLQESVPFGGSSSWPIVVPGVDSVGRLGRFDVNTVSSEYFATMGTRIVKGSGFANTDDARGRRVAVVGQSMAGALWPGQEPIGQCMKMWADSMPCRYVVGVAEDIHSQSLETESRLFFYYLPAAQWRPHDGGLFVRVSGDASRVVELVRRRLQLEMPGTSYVVVERLSDIVGVKTRSWIVGATIFTVFGALALVLAAVGLYSVIAYDVTQRRHELGVRLALGAARTGIVRLVVSQSVRLAVAGVVLGAIAARVGARWISPLLFHQSPHDPAVFGIVALVLLGAAFAAGSIPAWWAARLDPKTALQSD